MAVASLRWPGLRILEVGRTTPKGLVHQGPIVWGLGTGAILGTGFATRLGFWLWYVVPMMFFLLASPTHGLLIYGVYGLVRGTMSISLFIHGQTSANPSDRQRTLLLSYFRLRKASDIGLLMLAVAVFVFTGLREVR